MRPMQRARSSRIAHLPSVAGPVAAGRRAGAAIEPEMAQAALDVADEIGEAPLERACPSDKYIVVRGLRMVRQHRGRRGAQPPPRPIAGDRVADLGAG